MDNVINFDFPGKPKLFIHRVGRAARAGRIGTAYSLVSPEEMPFVVDLHLFLGKNLSTTDSKCSYGRIPQQILDHQSDNAASIIEASVDLTAMKKVVNNAYKLYFRTRANPSPESVQRAKDIIPPIPIHPIFASQMSEQETERFNMVESLKQFRPQQTIMEIKQKNRLVPMQSRVMPGTESKGSNAAEIMKKKNYIHGGLIAKKKEEIKIRQEEIAISGKKRKLENNFESAPPSKKRKKNNFKDEEFYMTHLKGDEYSERGLSVSDNFNKSSQDVVLDLMPDEKDKLQAKNQSMKWDRKKKKFIGSATTGPSIFGNETKNKKVTRNESGAVITSKTSKNL